jgi:hypothetical protein
LKEKHLAHKAYGEAWKAQMKADNYHKKVVSLHRGHKPGGTKKKLESAAEALQKAREYTDERKRILTAIEHKVRRPSFY